MEVFRTPDERFAGLSAYAFAPHYVELSGEMAGLRMHFVDVDERGEGEHGRDGRDEHGRDETLLLLHGEPTWAYLYRKMIPRLARLGRVIAPDFIGFGRSDKVTDIGWYSYQRHCDVLVQLIESLDLTDITVVVQDWGGPIGLRVATEHPERFARLVILNTGVFRPGPGWPTPGFAAWRDWAEQNPDMPIGLVVQGATASELSDDVIAGYEAPFPDAASKAGAAAFPLLVPLTPDDPGAAEMAEVREALGRWEKPALVAFSDSDPIFPLRAGEKMAERIPGAAGFVSIEGASHFLQEDAGEVIAEHVAAFIEGGEAGGAGGS